MPIFKYSFSSYDPLLHVRASGREVDVSHKAAREVCKTIKGKPLLKAKNYLEEVMLKRSPVHFRRYKKQVAHATSTEKFHSGRYPVKAAKEVLTVLESIEANAEFKGLDAERVKIVHAAAFPGRKVRGYTPRAYGRSSPSDNTLVHIEIVAGDV